MLRVHSSAGQLLRVVPDTHLTTEGDRAFGACLGSSSGPGAEVFKSSCLYFFLLVVHLYSTVHLGILLFHTDPYSTRQPGSVTPQPLLSPVCHSTLSLSPFQYYDLAADVLAENAHLTYKFLSPVSVSAPVRTLR